MEGVLQIQAARLGPEAMTSLALFHRLPLAPKVAPPLEVVMALSAGHPPGFVPPVAERHRRLLTETRAGNAQADGSRGLGQRAGLRPQEAYHPQDESRYAG